MDAAALRAALDRYDADMGRVNRELVLKHHSVRRHTGVLVELMSGRMPSGQKAMSWGEELARVSRLRWHAEAEAVSLRRAARHAERAGAPGRGGREVREREQAAGGGAARPVAELEQARGGATGAPAAPPRGSGAAEGHAVTLRQSDRAPNLWVADGVELPDDVHLGVNVVIHAGVVLGRECHVEDGVVLGKVARPNRGSKSPTPEALPTVIGAGTAVSAYTVVNAGVTLGEDVFLGDHMLVRERRRSSATAPAWATPARSGGPRCSGATCAGRATPASRPTACWRTTSSSAAT